MKEFNEEMFGSSDSEHPGNTYGTPAQGKGWWFPIMVFIVIGLFIVAAAERKQSSSQEQSQPPQKIHTFP